MKETRIALEIPPRDYPAEIRALGVGRIPGTSEHALLDQMPSIARVMVRGREFRTVRWRKKNDFILAIEATDHLGMDETARQLALRIARREARPGMPRMSFINLDTNDLYFVRFPYWPVSVAEIARELLRRRVRAAS